MGSESVGSLEEKRCGEPFLAERGGARGGSALCLTLGACAAVDSRGELPTVSSADLSRYVSVWYEIARLPMWVTACLLWLSGPRRALPQHVVS